jgi:hypothetical protein
MVGRFTARRSFAPEPALPVAPMLVPAAEPAPQDEETMPSFLTMSEPVKVPAEPANPLHSDKYLDAKVRLRPSPPTRCTPTNISMPRCGCTGS